MLLIVCILLPGVKLFASDVVIKSVDIESPSGNLNINIVKNEGGVYDLLITETSEIVSNASMIDFPFKNSRKAFDKEFKNALVSSIRLTYPEICTLISLGKIYDFSMSVNFDDKRELLTKRFWINVKADDLQVLGQVISLLSSDCRLLEMINEIAEQVYEKVPMEPRKSLSKDLRIQIENGLSGYFSNAYAKIEKDKVL